VHPILFERGAFVLSSYSVMLSLAFIAGGLVRHAETRRLRYDARPGFRWVAVGMLVGAVLGSKLGMLLYVDPSTFARMLAEPPLLQTAGKTVIGALFGAYLGVELTKRMIGLRGSTGDVLAIALPLSLAIGRTGCFLAGCCYGVPHEGLLSVHMAGAARHPVQLYEVALDLLLAAGMFSLRTRVAPAGERFKLCLIGYALIRLALDPLRGDPRVFAGPVSAVQIACVLAIAALSAAIVHQRRALPIGVGR